jgi:hypothetical protein
MKVTKVYFEPMDRETLVKAIKDEIAVNGEISFAVELYTGFETIIQNGRFTDECVIRDFNGKEVKESYDTIDVDVLENCYNHRMTIGTLFQNARLNTHNDKFLMVNLLNQLLKSKIGGKKWELGFDEYGNHYDHIQWKNGEYCVMIRYYCSSGDEDFCSEPLSNLSIETLTTIFHQFYM